MNKLTGDKNVNFTILMQLNDKELSMVCSVNKYVNELCKDETFWFNRVLLTFHYSPIIAKDMKSYLQFDNWKEFYFWLQEENFDVARTDLIPKSLDKKYVIDTIVEIFQKIKLPKWIDKEEFYKTFRRYAFINAQDDINQEYEHDEPEAEIDKIEFKTLKSFQQEEFDNIFISDWAKARDKYFEKIY
jgi:hypothetical protein